MDPLDPILDGLNSAQKAAVSSPSSVLQVLAPPGSGKTKTLTARVAYLLSHYRYRPQDVICCTFTIKASREMRERISKLIGNDVESRLILGTFHSICRRYLVRYGYLIGLERGFGIADSSDSMAIIKRIVKRLNSNIQPSSARTRISHQKARGVTPDELAVKYVKAVEQREFVEVYRQYEADLERSNLLDYDDLLLRCADLLRRNPECVSNIQAVLVDEFQDTNHIQYELMNLLASTKRRITVVGDPDQSIYGFRSAEIKNLTRMQQLYRDTSVVLLEDNYRSSGSILNSAQDVIEQDVSRPAKKLQSTHGVGVMPALRKLPSAQAEAQWIVLEIKRSIAMTGKLLNHSDFAVLLRSAALSRQIESEMGKQGIPYKMVGGSRFFDRVEIKLLLDYLRVVSQPGNTDALLRIINVPSRRIGEETIKMLLRSAEQAEVPLWNFIKDVAQGRRSTEKEMSRNQGLDVFVGLIESARRQLLECNDGSAPRKLLDFIIKKLSFREYLNKIDHQKEETRWANVEELLIQAGDMNQVESEDRPDDKLPEIDGLKQEEAHGGEEALSRFLANVALSTEIIEKDGGQDGEQPKAKVTISTIHAAKGLEWPVVFVPAVYNGIIPHSRAEDSDEERRLLYVAMTRAQALLYLSYPLVDSRSGAETNPTSFITPKIVKTRFRLTGPAFHEMVVHGIADILRRPKPSPEDIAKEKKTLSFTLDDRWTAEGKEPLNAITRFDGAMVLAPIDDEAPYPKKRRYDQDQSSKSIPCSSSAGYTMNNASNFSIPTTISLGFSTARQYISTNPMAEQEQKRATDSGSKPTAAARTTTGTVAGAGTMSHKSGGFAQGTLSSFVGRPPPKAQNTTTQSTLTNRHQPRQTSTKGTIGHITNHTSDPASKAAIPTQFQGHRPPAQPVQSSRPHLGPSDPNKYTWLAAPTEKPIMRTRPQDKVSVHLSAEGENQIERGAGEVKSDSSGSVGGVRPVATYHATSMSMIHQQGVTRKTLGVRRTAYTWEDRMKRERQ